MVVIVGVGLCSKDASEMRSQVEYFRQSTVLHTPDSRVRTPDSAIPECCDSRIAEKGVVEFS